jgi:DNA mismatch repair protein MutL
MTIKLLDPQLVARIAAGEVVERPASAVKELLENALDAGATRITVETREGGTGLIRVIDNGSGIPADEVELAFARHATSKISRFDDLESLSTLGFRGEALASIASVAEVELNTCTAGGSGSYIRLKEGNIAEQTGQARAQGTTVTVRNLFRNVPARLKFLKAPNTETGHVANVVAQYALAFPEVAFTLTTDGKTVLRTLGSGELGEAVAAVYGHEIAKNMLAVGGGDYQGAPEISVTGMAGNPSLNRSNRNFISLFVNRRWVTSRMLSFAVEEAYHGMLMTGKHPVAVLNVSIPASEIDVNIHPAKTEIKFHDEHRVFSAVQRAVRKALVEPPVPVQPAGKIEEPPVSFAVPPRSPVPLPFTTGYESKSPVKPAAEASRPVPAFSLPALRLLGQIAGTYIVAEGPDGLYLIDQHAAHERIQFEKVTAQMSVNKVEVQGLLEPATFEVDPQQDAVLRPRLAALADSGFLLEPFGERAYLVRTIPACLYLKDWAAVLRELTEGTESGVNWTEKLAESIACHSAVRAGQVMSGEEMRELLRLLEKAVLPTNCPHGRPTMIHLTIADLEKDFGRRG